MVRLEPLVEHARRLRGEPRRVGVHALMHGKTNTVSDVPRPEELDRTHRRPDTPSFVPESDGPDSRNRPETDPQAPRRRLGGGATH
jgi:hypothetical protein